MNNSQVFWFWAVFFVGLIIFVIRDGLARAEKKNQPKRRLQVVVEPAAPQTEIVESAPLREPSSKEDSDDKGEIFSGIPISYSYSYGKSLPLLELVYTNTREITDRRLVQPYRTRANTDYFEAFCHFDTCKRSFRFDRVSKATNMHTGEVLSQAELYKLIHPKRSPPNWLDKHPEF